MGLHPQHASRSAGIDANLVPPRGFITAAMDFAMVSSPKRYGKLVADLCGRVPVIAQILNGGHRRDGGRRSGTVAWRPI